MGIIKKNPVAGVERLPITEKKIRFLSLKEIDLVLERSPAYLRPIIVTAIHSAALGSRSFSGCDGRMLISFEDILSLLRQLMSIRKITETGKSLLQSN